MTKQETYAFLRARGVDFEAVEHRAVFNMEECAALHLPHPEADAKNLFVRDDKKLNYYLLTVRGEKRVNLKAFRRTYGTRSLGFASPDELICYLGLMPGSVSPLALLRDRARNVRFFLDEDFLLPPGRIGVHPNDNTATVFLQAADLLDLIRAHGNPVTTAKF